MSGFTKKVSGSLKDLGKKGTKKVLAEPFEILKTAGRQVTQTEASPKEELPGPRAVEQGSEPSQINEGELNLKKKRLLQALESELADIRKEKETEEARAQKEEEGRKSQSQEEKPLIEPSTKRPRKFTPLKGMKGKLEQLKRKSEIRMPPSG